MEDLKALAKFPDDKILGIGAIDVQNHRIEKPEDVARTIERVSKFVEPKWHYVNPGFGLNHLPRDIAFGKLRAMALGTKLAENKLLAGD